MKKYDSFIFDLDGTLLNTVGDLANALNFTLKKFGYEIKDLKTVESFLGNGISRLIAQSIPNEEENEYFPEIKKTFFEYYANHLYDITKPYEDIYNVLKILKDNKCKIAIVSNKADEFIQVLNDKFFKDYMDIAIGENENIRRKPHSDMVDYIVNKLNINKNTCVYIGDSEVDIETAKNSSIDCITVSWGFRSRDFLEKCEAEIIIDSPKQILDFVK